MLCFKYFNIIHAVAFNWKMTASLVVWCLLHLLHWSFHCSTTYKYRWSSKYFTVKLSRKISTSSFFTIGNHVWPSLQRDALLLSHSLMQVHNQLDMSDQAYRVSHIILLSNFQQTNYFFPKIQPWLERCLGQSFFFWSVDSYTTQPQYYLWNYSQHENAFSGDHAYSQISYTITSKVGQTLS